MKTPIFTGSGTAVITPFRGLKTDFAKMEELLDLQFSGGTSAIVVCGTTGENSTQPLEEHKKIVEHTIKYVNGRMKVIAGVGSNDTMTALELAEFSQKVGADGVMMVTPYYNKTSQRGLIEHFSYVADRINIPMIVYNVPGRTSIGCTADTYKVLSKHPNINGIKEASGDFSLIARTMSMCGDDLNFWSGNDDNTIPMMALGAVGVISVASNIVPRTVSDLCEFCLKGDFKAAAALGRKYADLFATLFIDVNPIPIKTAMNLAGLNVGDLRLPLVSMAPDTLEKLKKSMTAVGITLASGV